MTPAVDRRRFLVLAAVTPLAGCTGQLPGTEPERVDGDRLSRMAGGDRPTVPETLPVAIESSFISAEADHARDLLAEVPGPFDRDEIPNGAIRERLNRDHEHAQEHVGDIADAATPFERLKAAGRARVDAREVWATWQAIDADLTADAVREAAPDIREDIDAFASEWSYLGDDPVRAVRIHAKLERDISGARTWVAVDEREHARREDGPFGVGDVAEDLERARIDISAGSYLFDRFRQSLDRTSDLEPRLRDAWGELESRVRQRAQTLPDVEVDGSPSALVERDVERTAGLWALERLYRLADRARHGPVESSDEEPHVASDILGAIRWFALIQAFEDLKGRIEDGEDLAVTSAADVVALREDAIQAVKAARDDGQVPILTNAFLPRFARYVEYADQEFEHRSGEPTVSSVGRDAADYIVAAETARALPDVAAEVATVVRGS